MVRRSSRDPKKNIDIELVASRPTKDRPPAAGGPRVCGARSSPIEFVCSANPRSSSLCQLVVQRTLLLLGLHVQAAYRRIVGKEAADAVLSAPDTTANDPKQTACNHGGSREPPI